MEKTLCAAARERIEESLTKSGSTAHLPNPLNLLTFPAIINNKEVVKMIGWAITFLVISLIAGFLGFSGIAGAAAWMAKALFGIFLLMFVLFLVLGYTVYKKIT